MEQKKLEEMRRKAKFYAENSKETAKIWKEYIKKTMTSGTSCLGIAIDSTYSRKKQPKKYFPKD